jgi:glycerol-3-phosphate dehydrogenase (NAD(P)+)
MSPAKRSPPIEIGTPIGILGAGAWGTALAVHLARTGHAVVLRGRSESLMRTIAKKRRNPTYLANVEIPREVEATADIRRVAACSTVLVVVPSHGFRAAVRELFAARSSKKTLLLVSGTKGVEAERLARMSQVALEEAKSARLRVEPAAVSGPSFAEELAGGSRVRPQYDRRAGDARPHGDDPSRRRLRRQRQHLLGPGRAR